MPNTGLTALQDDSAGLAAVAWRDRKTKREGTAPIRNLFLFIGAVGEGAAVVSEIYAYLARA